MTDFDEEISAEAQHVCCGAVCDGVDGPFADGTCIRYGYWTEAEKAVEARRARAGDMLSDTLRVPFSAPRRG